LEAFLSWKKVTFIPFVSSLKRPSNAVLVPLRVEETYLQTVRCTFSEYVFILGLQILSVLDVVFTLILISEGGLELNPLMALALEGGYTTFSVIKIGITTLSLLVFVAHIHLRHVRYIVAALCFLYVGLCGCHLYSLLIIHSF
jgi:hypothetical protein